MPMYRAQKASGALRQGLVARFALLASLFQGPARGRRGADLEGAADGQPWDEPTTADGIVQAEAQAGVSLIRRQGHGLRARHDEGTIGKRAARLAALRRGLPVDGWIPVGLWVFLGLLAVAEVEIARHPLLVALNLSDANPLSSLATALVVAATVPLGHLGGHRLASALRGSGPERLLDAVVAVAALAAIGAFGLAMAGVRVATMPAGTAAKLAGVTGGPASVPILGILAPIASFVIALGWPGASLVSEVAAAKALVARQAARVYRTHQLVLNQIHSSDSIMNDGRLQAPQAFGVAAAASDLPDSDAGVLTTTWEQFEHQVEQAAGLLPEARPDADVRSLRHAS